MNDKRNSKRRNSSTTRTFKGKRFSKEGNRKHGKGVTNSFDEVEFGPKTSATNDITWYNRNPGLLKASCSISYGDIQGYPINVNNTILTAPGVMAITYVSAPGTASGYDADVVNVAAKDIFSRIRKNNSGASNYDPNDLMMFFLALGEAYSWHAYVSRLYGTLCLYNVHSGYAPRALVEAQGFDFDDMIKNMPGILSLLDSFAAKVNRYAAPKVFDYFSRQYWLPKNVYMDNATNKHQLYLFKPLGYRTWGLGSEGQSELIFHKYPSKMTYSDIWNITNDIVHALTAHEDIGIMSGDVRKAFDTEVWSLEAYDSNYAITPVCDTTVLSQIENMTICGGPVDGSESEFNLKTSNELGHSNVLFNPTLTSPTQLEHDVTFETLTDPRAKRVLLNAHTNETTPEYVMESTRLSALVDFNQIVSMGTEIVTGVDIHTGILDNNKSVTQVGYTNLGQGEIILNGASASKALPNYLVIQQWYMFDWAPKLFVAIAFDDGVENTVIPTCLPLIELENYTVVEETTLDNMHYCALLSLFNVINS